MFQLWIDVGGTFTDALLVDPADGNPSSDPTSAPKILKVLSSGRVPLSVIERRGNRVRVQGMPVETSCVDFWRGCTVIDSNLDPSQSCVVVSSQSDWLTLSKDHPSDSISLSTGLHAPVLAAKLLLATRLPYLTIDGPMPPIEMRLGTTRGTNALLTRHGAETVLIVTSGFGDVLRIGEQDRPELYTLDVRRAPPLTQHVIEVHERLDAQGRILVELDEPRLKADLSKLSRDTSLAISLVHSHTNDVHERKVEAIAREMGFKMISRSSEVIPLINHTARSETTTLDAYLNPFLESYVQGIVGQLATGDHNETSHPTNKPSALWLMTSAGNLVPAHEFRGRDSILSGPAGGVVALAAVTRQAGLDSAIGLDMGGTSTDVSHYDGKVARSLESRVAGVRVMTPMMDIETVAAGGGSICTYRDRRLAVGPDSAGADPGPACYGRGGPLCVTDLNVLLGRLGVDRFPFTLSLDAARDRLNEIYELIPIEDRPATPEDLAESLLRLAIAHMAGAVRTVTTARGNDVRKMGLFGFGGAAGGHLCRIADELGMSQIIDHPASSVLSAVGMGLSQPGRVATQGIQSTENLKVQIERLRQSTIDRFYKDYRFATGSPVEIDETVSARYVGTESTLAIDANPIETIADRFHVEHHRVFGYQKSTSAVEVASAEVEVRRPASRGASSLVPHLASQPPTRSQMFASGRWHPIDVWDRDSLHPDQPIDGPALIVSDFSTLVVEPDWTAQMSVDGLIRMVRRSAPSVASVGQHDIADVEIYARRLQGIADSMGEVLRRTAISVNVKQRRDYSCAVFAADGALLAGALHVPVHLGAMSQTVREMIRRFPSISRGDVLVTNDPFAGGSHLPDVTVVQPVHSDPKSADDPGRLLFFVASRAHHAEIGGMTPGSMPPFATNLAQEGVLIRPMKLIDGGVDRFDEVARILTTSDYPTRRLNENLADLRAQVAAGVRGANDLCELAERVGHQSLGSLSARWLDVAGDAVSKWIESLPDGQTTASDQLDDGTKIAVRMQRKGLRLQIELESEGLHPHGFNAPTSISVAAVLYVLRCFCSSRLPLCDGVLRDVDLKISPGLLCPTVMGDDPKHWPAVVAGNVETSNRLVDVLIQAITNWPGHSSTTRRIVAASGGTMNNTLFGDDTFGYYETMGVGSGATDVADGESAVQTHMTNTRITDVEVLESKLPIRLHRFAIRPGTGGVGVHRGGNGLVREFEFLTKVSVSLLTNRRTTSPPGAGGGGDGAPGQNTRVEVDGQRQTLPPCTNYTANSGERLIVETPGGGGVGAFCSDPPEGDGLRSH